MQHVAAPKAEFLGLTWYRVLGTGYWVLGTGYWVPDTEYRVLSTTVQLSLAHTLTGSAGPSAARRASAVWPLSWRH